MTPSTRRRKLLKLAKQCVWWKPPAETLRDTSFFLAHVMTFGTWDDAVAMRACFTFDEIREALRTAPPGVFDARSWHYWHHVVGIHDVPERPVRRIPGAEPSPPTSKRTSSRF